jgi:hypothetical protein
MRNAMTASRVQACAAGLVLAAAAGCGADPTGPGNDPAGGVVGAPTPEAPPTPVATLPLEGGSVLEFYDFGTGAVVSETGLAGVKPRFNPQGALGSQGAADATQLVSIWESMASHRAVPQALIDLQQRLSTLPPEAVEAADVPLVVDGKPLAERQPSPRGDDLLAAPSGCNNGCCDYEWLSTLPQCQGNGDYSWFLYNYGYSHANSGSVGMYRGLVCSAEGTSTYRVAVTGGGGTWSIPEAYYRTYFWMAGTTCNPFCHYATKTVSSSVNGSGDQHLHTYCGNFTY